ncbi:RNA polymerase sigma-70 factor, ECF subfamily [Filimonas lacunae]|uniref:RNA polymerase sigma-70 factor, ECF subfamily n=2 Tax=Filimonas lacunae TaxID=477680 RepID=A0A1N7RIC3_9BACT|nr:RNA polymerase sigma-70 factor, ECF subfamily [Filimonas lacunae]
MSAFEEIYNRYWNKLFDAAYHRIKQKETCEEIIQEVFVVLWEKRESLDITTSLGAYLFSAVKYKVIDYYRKQLVRARNAPALAAITSIDNSAEEQVFLNDLMVHIDKLVMQLPVKCRSVYELSRIEHKSNKEIASLLNISEKTVEGHLTKALQVLRLAVGNSVVILLLVAAR